MYIVCNSYLNFNQMKYQLISVSCNDTRNSIRVELQLPNEINSLHFSKFKDSSNSELFSKNRENKCSNMKRHKLSKKILNFLCDFWLQALRVTNLNFISKHSLHYTNKPTTQQIRD